MKRSLEHKPVVIDVFSGVGGLSLGATQAGFSVAAAVENDVRISGSHSVNFPNTEHISEDASSLRGKNLLKLAGMRKGQLDGLIGGPPCQGFSFMGRQDIKDKRNSLFFHFFRLVAETKPKFFLAENVPGILSPSFASIREKALAQVRDEYEVLEPITVVASKYGAPTARSRIFFVGYKPKSMAELTEESFAPTKSTIPVCVGEALKGLPYKIDPEWQTEEQGWRSIGEVQMSQFLRRVTGNAPEGVGDDKALERYFGKRKVSGCLGTVHQKDVIARFSKLGPGEQDPVSKAIRLDSKGLCPTLRAGTGSDRGSYQAVRPIHHREDRVITPREAARLQGFPDWFMFHETKWHSFRQIGNSVSPIVSKRLLQVFAKHLVEG